MADQNDQEDILAEMDEQYGDAGMADVGTRPDAASMPKCGAVVKATNVYVNRSSGGRKQLTAVLEILSCEAGEQYVKATAFKNWGLETDKNLEWLNTDLANLDIERPKNPKDILRCADELMAIEAFKVSFVPNSDAQYPSNIYINKGALNVDMGLAAANSESQDTEQRF